LGWDLYCRESTGEKPWRENPEYYEEMHELRVFNQRVRLYKTNAVPWRLDWGETLNMHEL
jgi:hypothetical protein